MRRCKSGPLSVGNVYAVISRLEQNVVNLTKIDQVGKSAAPCKQSLVNRQ